MLGFQAQLVYDLNWRNKYRLALETSSFEDSINNDVPILLAGFTEVVKKYSNEGDYILDPFAGRCSSIYAGGVLGRHSLGIEINPVGWLYVNVKLNPAKKSNVVDRLFEVYGKRNYYSRAI